MSDLFNNPLLSRVIPAIFLAGLLWLSALVLQEFIYSLIWAFIIAYVCWPLNKKLRAVLRGNVTLSAALMVGIIAMLLLLSIYYLVDMLQIELKLAYQMILTDILERSIQLPAFIKNIPWLGHHVDEWSQHVMNNRTQVLGQFVNWGRQWLGGFAKLLGGIGKHLVKLGMVLLTVFFCFRDGDKITNQLSRGLGYYLGKYHYIYVRAAANTTRGVVYGIVLAALGQGLLAAIGYALAGLKAPVLLGIMTALLALVPIGAVLVWLPCVLGLLASDQFWPGLGLFFWGLFVVSTVDNLIRPIVISGASRVPFLVVVFGVLGGLSAFGLIGLFIGPVILSVLLSVWQVWMVQIGDPNAKIESG